MTANVQKIAADKEARERIKAQLAEYLAGQPASIQSLHRWMKRLEVAGIGIIVAAFIVALYVSIAWKSVKPSTIPIAWFIFAASVAPALIFVGLDAITLRAFSPVVWPGKPPKFVTGSGAMWVGWAFILLALVIAAFWGFFVYAVGTLNFALIAPLVTILGVIMGVVMAVSIIYKLIHGLSRFR